MQGGKSLIEYIVSAVSGAGADADSLPNVMEIIDEMPGGFFIYRAGGEEEILYANAALLRILGWRRQGGVLRSDRQFLPGDGPPGGPGGGGAEHPGADCQRNTEQYRK